MPFISKSVAVFSLCSICILTTNCQSEKAPASEPNSTTQKEKVAQPPAMELEVLKLLKKEPFDRNLIFEQTKTLDLEQKLVLVNRLAEEHKIERMNMLKARVKMGTIHSEQSSQKHRANKQKNLEKLDGILSDWAREEGHVK